MTEPSPSTLAHEPKVTPPQAIHFEPDEDEKRLLIKLGAAVSLLWPHLPEAVREEVHARAASILLPPSYGALKHCGAHDELTLWLNSCRLKHL